MEVTGIKYPFTITANGLQTSKLNDTGTVDLLRESIAQIVATSLNERVREKTYGSDFKGMVFKGMDDVLKQALQNEIINAVSKWEPRVVIVASNFAMDDLNGRIKVVVKYKVRRTGREDEFQFQV